MPTCRTRCGYGRTTALSCGSPPDYIDRLEHWCDGFGDPLPNLTSFILPGGTPAAANLHVARTVVRRAERAAWLATRRTAARP